MKKKLVTFNSKLLAMVALCALIISGTAAGWCIQNPQKLSCGNYYMHYSTMPDHSSYDFDSPQACGSYDEEKWACLTAPEDPFAWGYKYPYTYSLSYTCISGSGCY